MTETLNYALRRALIPLVLRNLRSLIADDPAAAIAWIDASLEDDARAQTHVAAASAAQP